MSWKIAPILLWLSFLIASCAKNSQLQYALMQAEDNRKELEKVLEHYCDSGLKYKAALFLVENLPWHFAIVDSLVAPSGKRYYPDIAQIGGADEVKRYYDSLYAIGYYRESRREWDGKRLKASYLIQQIDLAFTVWSKPWAKSVSFEDFCSYILPYRSLYEPPSMLRQTLMEQYVPRLVAADVQTPIEACNLLNSLLKEEIKYAETGSPLAATIEETARTRRGTCDALCNYTVLAMRAAGIPVAVHQTIWTRMNRGHVWPAVLSNGRFFDFSPGDVNTDEYMKRLYKRWYLQPAKVYRQHYECLIKQQKNVDDGYVTWLKSPLIKDVTDEGGKGTFLLKVPLVENARLEQGQILYLCTFNNFHWTPLAIGEADGKGNACFPKVRGRNFLIVAEANKQKSLKWISMPFCTDGSGGIRLLPAIKELPVRHTFHRTGSSKPDLLDYWDGQLGQFVAIEPVEVTDSTQTYANIPAQALLFFRSDSISLTSRVGIIDTDGVYKDSGTW